MAILFDNVEFDNSAWHPDDKAWLAERKKEWVYIQHNLKSLGKLIIHMNGFLKAHKKLYFEGIYDERLSPNGYAFGGKFPLFLMWYHPALTVGVADSIIELCKTARSLSLALLASRECLIKYTEHSSYKPEYGFMGGGRKRQ